MLILPKMLLANLPINSSKNTPFEVSYNKFMLSIDIWTEECLDQNARKDFLIWIPNICPELSRNGSGILYE